MSNRWTVGVLAAIALVATAVAAATSSGSSTTIVATQPNVPVGPGTLPKPAPKPTTTTGPLPKAPGAVPSAPTGLTAWPATGTAYTDVLASIDLSAGRSFAIARARQAKAGGLPQAGVLVSSTYPSLHPGYFVVFSGIYPTPAQASAALAAAHAKGFPDAYVARVTHR